MHVTASYQSRRGNTLQRLALFEQIDETAVEKCTGGVTAVRN